MIRIHIQQVGVKKLAPKTTLLRQWAKQTLSHQIKAAEITIRIVDKKEMTQLNKKFRNKKGPTNVLSFPIFLSKDIKFNIPPLGDIIICSEVIHKEATEQNKLPEAHYAHMVVHGIFHLLGYNHERNEEAHKMESLEIAALKRLGFNNPYDTGKDNK